VAIVTDDEALVSTDYRRALFEGAHWYGTLAEDTPDHWVLWRVSRSSEPAWWNDVLEAAAAFADDHGLLELYKARVSSIPLRDLRQSVADSEARSAVAPIWDIVNELIVARYLEKVLRWKYESHEPNGHRTRKGDWAFVSPAGRRMFVEVKSLTEAPPRETGVYSRGIESSRLTSVLKEAYRQLPSDRSTVVVVVGMWDTLSVARGIAYGDLFQTLFGQMQITINVMPYDPDSARIGPSFRDRFIHHAKHRRLGCAFGLMMNGADYPGLDGYAIHNPYAHAPARSSPADFQGARQFWVDEAGRGSELEGVHPVTAWSMMALPSHVVPEALDANGR
jgi:hypothetical protein